jgi:hypothetical protein
MESNRTSRLISASGRSARLLGAAVALFMTLVAPGPAAAGQFQKLEPGDNAPAATPVDAKAELLYNVAKFIEWPPVRPPAQPPEEFTFSILGEDEFAGALAASFSTKTINGLPVFVRCVRRPQDARDSHMLFVAATEEQRIPEVIAALEGTNVLTVADVPSFATAGGMVAFVIENGKVQFEINPAPAKKAGLKISAKLLALSRIVDPRASKP